MLCYIKKIFVLFIEQHFDLSIFEGIFIYIYSLLKG